MQLKELPEGLKPYFFHGVELEYTLGNQEAEGDCPICSREGKFHVNAETSKFNCKKCGESGNATSFLRWLHNESESATKQEDYESLKADRNLLYTETLFEWRIVKSALSGDWLVPGFNPEGKLVQLYKYTSVKAGNRKLLATPSSPHGLFIPYTFNKNHNWIYVCEGPWDAMCLQEVFSRIKWSMDGELKITSSRKESLEATERSIIALPGCTTFKEGWIPMFEGKNVVLCLDNDYPKKNKVSGKLQKPAAYQGIERISKMLGSVAESVSSVVWSDTPNLNNPTGGGYHNEKMPSGTDIRDYLTQTI